MNRLLPLVAGGLLVLTGCSSPAPAHTAAPKDYGPAETAATKAYFHSSGADKAGNDDLSVVKAYCADIVTKGEAATEQEYAYTLKPDAVATTIHAAKLYCPVSWSIAQS